MFDTSSTTAMIVILIIIMMAIQNTHSSSFNKLSDSHRLSLPSTSDSINAVRLSSDSSKATVFTTNRMIYSFNLLEQIPYPDRMIQLYSSETSKIDLTHIINDTYYSIVTLSDQEYQWQLVDLVNFNVQYIPASKNYSQLFAQSVPLSEFIVIPTLDTIYLLHKFASVDSVPVINNSGKTLPTVFRINDQSFLVFTSEQVFHRYDIVNKRVIFRYSFPVKNTKIFKERTFVYKEELLVWISNDQLLTLNMSNSDSVVQFNTKSKYLLLVIFLCINCLKIIFCLLLDDWLNSN
jgi:hypothetical protein